MPDPSDPNDRPPDSAGAPDRERQATRPGLLPAHRETVEAFLAQRLQEFDETTSPDLTDDVPTLTLRPPPARVEMPPESRTTVTPPGASRVATPRAAELRVALRSEPPASAVRPAPQGEPFHEPVYDPPRPESTPPRFVVRATASVLEPEDPVGSFVDGVPVDEDSATESHESEPVFVRPSNAWGHEHPLEPVTFDEFEIPDVPSSEVTKPSALPVVEAWDLLGEQTDGKGFEERTPPGGWAKPAPTPVPTARSLVPPASDRPAPSVVSLSMAGSDSRNLAASGPIDEDEQTLQPGRESTVDLDQMPTTVRRPTPFDRYAPPDEESSSDHPTVLSTGIDEVFPGEDTREMLGVLVDDEPPPTLGGTSWTRMPPRAEVIHESTHDTLVAVPDARNAESPGLGPPWGSDLSPATGADTVRSSVGDVLRGEPSRNDSVRGEPMRTPAALSPRSDTRPVRPAVPRPPEPDSEEPPPSSVARVVWTVVTWGAVMLAFAGLVVLAIVVAAMVLQFS